MARAHLYRSLADTEGDLLTSAEVRFLDPGTSTVASGIEDYDGDPITGLITLSDGIINVYAEEPTRVDVEVTRGGQTTLYRDLDLLAPPEAAPGGGDSHTLGDAFDAKNADRYDRRRYSTAYKTSASVTVANGAKIPLPLSDDYNDEGGSVEPLGLDKYVISGTQYGVSLKGRGLYWVNVTVGIDTTGGAYDVFICDKHSYNGYLHVQRLDPAFSDRPSRIVEWSGIVPSSGTDDPTSQDIWVQLGNGSGTNKVLSAWIAVFPL
jgi:hypothetical protein